MPYPLWWRVIQPYPYSSRHRSKIVATLRIRTPPRPVTYHHPLSMHLQWELSCVRLCDALHTTMVIISHQFPRLKLIRCPAATLDKLYVVLPTLSSLVSPSMTSTRMRRLRRLSEAIFCEQLASTQHLKSFVHRAILGARLMCLLVCPQTQFIHETKIFSLSKNCINYRPILVFCQQNSHSFFYVRLILGAVYYHRIIVIFLTPIPQASRNNQLVVFRAFIVIDIHALFWPFDYFVHAYFASISVAICSRIELHFRPSRLIFVRNPIV